jgi:hypothetical protein
MEQRSRKNKKKPNYSQKIVNGSLKILKKENEIIREIYEKFLNLGEGSFIKTIRRKKNSLISCIKCLSSSKLIAKIIIISYLLIKDCQNK